MIQYLMYVVIKFFVQALALKLAVDVVKEPGVENKYGKAVTLSAGFVFVSALLGFIPLIGWLLYLGAWCVMVMRTYRLSLTRSVFVAVLQSTIGFLIFTALKWLGLLSSSVHSVF